MTSELFQEFPELSRLRFGLCPCNYFSLRIYYFYNSREDLEDLLSDSVYFQAIFHSLQQVKDLYNAQTELGMANEAIASK